MSDLGYYVSLLHNPSRLGAFQAGIEGAVRPGDTVLDLGTGLGTYAFFAARAGAGAVWAVDHSPVVEVARQLARANGFGESIRFVQGRVPGAQLPPRVDVLVFEDFGVAFLDARTRDMLGHVYPLLAEGARTVPRAARLTLAPVRSPACWEQGFPPSAPAGRPLGLEWGPLRALAANHPRRVALHPDQLLAPGVPGPDIPLARVPSAEDLEIRGAWVAGEAATLHGLALWFDLEVAQGRWISNAPGPGCEPWGQLFLPLDPPMEVPQGIWVEARCWREGTRPQRPDWVAWEVRADGQSRRGHEFAGQLLDRGDLGLAPSG